MIAFFVNVHFTDDAHNYFTVNTVETPLEAIREVVTFLADDPASFAQIVSIKVTETAVVDNSDD